MASSVPAKLSPKIAWSRSGRGHLRLKVLVFTLELCTISDLERSRRGGAAATCLPCECVWDCWHSASLFARHMISSPDPLSFTLTLRVTTVVGTSGQQQGRDICSDSHALPRLCLARLRSNHTLLLMPPIILSFSESGLCLPSPILSESTLVPKGCGSTKDWPAGKNEGT